jgi:hypothetical protein
MGKRELAAYGDVDVYAPRPKRRRDTDTPTIVMDNANQQKEEPSSDTEQPDVEEENAMTVEEIRDAGRKVLQLLKDAVDKE